MFQEDPLVFRFILIVGVDIMIYYPIGSGGQDVIAKIFAVPGISGVCRFVAVDQCSVFVKNIQTF